jgi:hypothetical protein
LFASSIRRSPLRSTLPTSVKGIGAVMWISRGYL